MVLQEREIVRGENDYIPLHDESPPTESDVFPQEFTFPEQRPRKHSQLNVEHLQGETVDERFTHAFASYYQRIYAFMMRILGNHQDAEDAAQETFVNALGVWEKFEHAEGQYLSAWLHRTARNNAVTILRRQRIRRAHSLEEDTYYGEIEPDMTPIGELRGLLVNAIMSLPPRQRETFLFHHLDGLPFNTIAEKYDESSNAAKNRSHRAKNALARNSDLHEYYNS